MKYHKLLTFLLSTLLLNSCSTLSADEQEKIKNKKIAQINMQLGMGYLEKNDMQRAKQKLLYALQKSPELPEAWYSMAYFQEMTGNHAEANKDYLKSIDLAPKRGDVQNNYGTFLCRTGKYQESIRHFVAATKDMQYLDSAGAYENAGLCALKIPDKQQAIKYFTLALEQDPTREALMTQITELRG
ncbi:MAG: type IV pilus biogenesis/stability protein PilW [Gammaproteobacteria bacterium]